MTKKIVAVVEIPFRKDIEEVDVDPKNVANTISAVKCGAVDAVELRRADFGYGDTRNFWLDDCKAQVVNSYYVEERGQ